jgi:release factor glutamine methyltransferase
MTLGEWLVSARERLASVDNPSLEAQILAGHALMRDRTWVIAHPEAEVPELVLEGMLQRREMGEPLPYILGYREFFGLRFEVNRHVLIPRQETETLAEAALGRFPGGPKVLDLGTGSGCVAIALKATRPAYDMWAVDLSDRALAVARRNGDALLGPDSIHWVEGDGLELIKRERFDLVVTNPPYVAEGDKLGPGVGEYEPHLALYSGKTGLEFYEALAAALPLETALLTEVGDGQAAAVAPLFGRPLLETFRDLGGMERVLLF